MGLTRIVGRLGHIAATGRVKRLETRLRMPSSSPAQVYHRRPADILCAPVIEVSQIEKISDDSDARWMEFSEGTPDQIFDSGQLLQA